IGAAEAGQGPEIATAGLLSLDVGDIYSLAFEEDSFDLVVAIGTIPWLTQPQLAIREMARVTRPGGHIILTANNRAALNKFLDPRLNVMISPLKLWVRQILGRAGPWRLGPDEPRAIHH